jgi:hypothetical protein
MRFDEHMTSFYITGDPAVFPARARSELIKKVISSNASFSDLRLLTTLKDNSDDSTPVALALYPASPLDFSIALESRAVIGGSVYYMLPFAENCWMCAGGNFLSKDLCQWCGAPKHPYATKCEIGERHSQELEAFFISQMFRAYVSIQPLLNV